MKEEGIHIGEIIKEFMKSNRITDAELASKIGTTRQNIPNIYKKKSIDTARLKKISDKLNHDFFQYFKIDKKQETVDNKKTEASAKFLISIEITGDEAMKLGIKEKMLEILKNK